MTVRVKILHHLTPAPLLALASSSKAEAIVDCLTKIPAKALPGQEASTLQDSGQSRHQSGGSQPHPYVSNSSCALLIPSCEDGHINVHVHVIFISDGEARATPVPSWGWQASSGTLRTILSTLEPPDNQAIG